MKEDVALILHVKWTIYHPKPPIFLPAAQVASSAKGKDNWPTALQLPTYLQHVCSKQRLRVSLAGKGQTFPALVYAPGDQKKAFPAPLRAQGAHMGAMSQNSCWGAAEFSFSPHCTNYTVIGNWLQRCNPMSQ